MVHRIDTPGNVSGRFSAGNPFALISGTEVGATWANMVQDELENVVVAGGQTLSKSNNAQLLEAIQNLIGAGNLPANLLGNLNGARLGSPIAGEFRRALDCWRVQVGSTGGFRMPRLRTSLTSYAQFEPVADFTIPRGYLAHGGTIRFKGQGYIIPASNNPGVGLALVANGTPLRSSGIYGAFGYFANNNILGSLRILRRAFTLKDYMPAAGPLPFFLDVEIESLGKDGAQPGAWIGPGANNDGDGNTVVRGELVFRPLLEGKGDDIYSMGASDGKVWATATAYTIDGAIVEHYGTKYVCSASHTSAAATEPGVGADWKKYWSTWELRLNIHHGAEIDWESEVHFEVDVAPAYQVDGSGASAWSSSSVSYTLTSYVTHGGNTYLCLEAHTSDANKEPGNSVGAKDGERYWAEVDKGAGDVVHWSRLAAYVMGGAEGLGALL